jgi:hypothetical protein
MSKWLAETDPKAWLDLFVEISYLGPSAHVEKNGLHFIESAP